MLGSASSGGSHELPFLGAWLATWAMTFLLYSLRVGILPGRMARGRQGAKRSDWNHGKIMPDPEFILSINIAVTLFLAGIIWFVQVVHYPLFASVGPSQFARYETQHAGRTTWIVAPPMMIEAVTSLLLVWVRPAAVSASAALTGFLLVGLIWAATFAMQVPLHARLSGGFEPGLHRSLVATNWVRTLAWTARAWLALTMI